MLLVKQGAAQRVVEIIQNHWSCSEVVQALTHTWCADKSTAVDDKRSHVDTTPPKAAAEPTKAAPISLEEMLEKKRKQDEELAKPKFLTKAQRAEIALKKRQEEADVSEGAHDAPRIC